jgi:hypothetical protein
MTIANLIDTLTESATPVRRLRPPCVRATLWITFAALLFAGICLVHGMRPDMAERLRQPEFLVGMAGALATGILAAIAAFAVSLPDRSQSWLLLPVPALLLWMSTIGYGCLTDWVRIGPDGIFLGETVQCFALLLLTGVPLTIAMLVMVRYAALLRPTAVSLMAGLSVAAMTAFFHALIHDHDATIMIIMWNVGASAVIAGLSGLFGRSLMAWIASHLAPFPKRMPMSSKSR